MPDRATPTPSTAAGTVVNETTSSPVRLPSNLQIRRLDHDEKPPQFVLFSFDGVGASPNWDLFLDTAKRTNARFSALMTGLYFLTDDAKSKYRGPRHRPGEAALAFGGSKQEVRAQIDQLNRTWYLGHEMGTHYVGHFCRGTRFPGASWTTADWNHEPDQFFSLMQNWRKNTGITGGDDLAFGVEAVKGGRTQCLEGTQGALFPALRSHAMTWDSSIPARQTGLTWPRKSNGIWEFEIPYVYSPPLRQSQTALDYNFWYTHNKAIDTPRDAPKIRKIVSETYDYMYRRAFEGNRAPLVIANHFNEWSGNAFNPAAADFMAKTCSKPQTLCVTHTDLANWLEVQDPQQLAQWQARAPVAVSATT